LPDGTPLPEVAAILTYLAHAEPGLRRGPTLWIHDWPGFYRWTVFLAVNIYEGVLRRSYTQRYAMPLAQAAPSRARTLPDDIDAVVALAVCQGASQRIHSAFQCLERETAGRAFLLGDRMSPADIFLAMLYAWYNQKPDLPKCTWITTQVATHPVIRPIWKRNFEQFLDFKWHAL
ncbi:MAG: hypothetical protein AAF631_11325, partial [Pseudomonadota bacterium]